MIRVIGTSPRKVPLKDLNDSIYYRQQKIYSDSDHQRSKDLQREIKAGNIMVLSEVKEKVPGTQDLEYSTAELGTNATTKSPTELSSLMQKLMEMDQAIKNISGVSDGPKMDTAEISAKIKSLEDKLGGMGGVPEGLLKEILDKLGDKLEKNSKVDDLLNRFEVILGRAGTAPMASQTPHTEPIDQIYVPRVTVEDAKTHIKLNMRTIENGSEIEASLKKLRELRKSE